MIDGTIHLSPDEIKQRGAHYTPSNLANFLAERALDRVTKRNGSIRVLDPACGDGSLLKAIVRNAPPELRSRLDLIGYETDDHAMLRAQCELSKLSVPFTLLCADFLDAAEPAMETNDVLFPPNQDRPSVDLVISNPPYVRTQVLGAARSRDLAKRFGLTGRVDLYHAFIIAMWSMLSPRGVLALLTSNRFMTIQSGASVRKILRKEFDLFEIYDLGDTKLFNAAVLPAIVIAEKAEGAQDRSDTPAFCRVYESRETMSEITVPTFSTPLDAIRMQHDGLFASGGARYLLTSGRLKLNGDATAPWSLESRESQPWLESVERNTARQFGDIALVRVGIKTTADNVFIRSDWDQLPKSHQPEAERLLPLLTHHVAARWQSTEARDMRVLYTHEAGANGKRNAIELDEWPRTKKYLESHRHQLESREYVLNAGRNWYEIWVPQQPSDWQMPKVVYPDIAESPTFFFDDSGAVVNGDCYWITLRDNVKSDWLFALLAVANSTFIESFYDRVFHNKLYAGRRRFMTQFVRHFPLPSLDGGGHELAVAVRELIQLAPCHRERAWSELDRKVWSAFDLKPP